MKTNFMEKMAQRKKNIKMFREINDDMHTNALNKLKEICETEFPDAKTAEIYLVSHLPEHKYLTSYIHANKIECSMDIAERIVFSTGRGHYVASYHFDEETGVATVFIRCLLWMGTDGIYSFTEAAA